MGLDEMEWKPAVAGTIIGIVIAFGLFYLFIKIMS